MKHQPYMAARLGIALGQKDHLAELIKAPCPGVVTFPAFSNTYCRTLIRDLPYMNVAPNSMNKYGVILKDIGYGELCDYLLKTVVKPLAKRLYPELKPLRKTHGFIVNYDTKKQSSLDLHYDDASVTLNICLGKSFKGGNLVFLDEVGFIDGEVKHKVGQGILHLGSKQHQARHITAGQRSNLILWCS